MWVLHSGHSGNCKSFVGIKMPIPIGIKSGKRFPATSAGAQAIFRFSEAVEAAVVKIAEQRKPKLNQVGRWVGSGREGYAKTKGVAGAPQRDSPADAELPRDRRPTAKS